MITLLQNFLPVLPLVAALLVLRTANVPRARRHQQFLLPVVAVVFALAAIIVLYRFNEWFDSILRAVFTAVPFLESFYQTRWLSVIQNIVIVVVFLAVKFGHRAIAGRVFTGDRFLGSGVVERFYEYDAASGRWNLREQLSQLRLLYRVLFWSSLAITVLLIVMMGAVPAWPGFQAIAFPAVAVLVLGEVFAALDGITRQEASDLIAGEDDSASRQANYAALREVFRDAFPDRVLDEGVDLSAPRSRSAHAALTALSSSDQSAHRLYGEYFDRAKRNGLAVDENLLHASLDLLGGRSVLINTPFYSDLTAYLTLPAYIRLLRGGKTLIVTGRDAGAVDIATWAARGLEQITGVPDLWDVQLLGEETQEGLDVGVLRSADLHNVKLLAANDGFLHDVETVLLAEPSRLLATGQLGLGVVVSRLAQGAQPVYVAFDRNHDGLVDALSHLLKVSLTDVIATQHVRGASSEMVWSAEGTHLAADILPGVARYLGTGVELAAVALKYHVSEVDWVGGDRFPVTDISWIAGQYFAPITAFAELEPSQRALSSLLRPVPNPLAITQAERRFLIVEDEFSNVYEALRLFASRSTESGFIHLISEDYLLRDYMVDNRELFLADAKAIPSIVADYARTSRNTILRLVLMLSSFPVAESAITRELELAGWSTDEAPEDSAGSSTIALLTEIVARYLGVDAAFEQVAGARIPAADDDPDHPREPLYRLLPGSALDRASHELRSAYFLMEDEMEGRDFIGACLHGHVHQTVLPGQFLTVAGKYYEVVSVGSADRPAEVILRRAAEHITGRPAYRPLRRFRIDARRLADSSAPRVTSDTVTVERSVISLSAESTGYLELPSRGDLLAARRVDVNGLVTRRYVEKDALRIAIPSATPEVRGTIAVLLNELFVTLFPSAHSFIAAVTADPRASFGDLLPAFSAYDDDEEAIYIVEDSSVDLGLVIAVERHWRRIFETVTDYLTWAHRPPEPSDQSEEAPLAVFPGESPEEARARVERSEQPPDAVEPVSFWQRLIRRIRRVFSGGRRQAVEEAASPQPSEVTGPRTGSPTPPPPAPVMPQPPRVVAAPEVSFTVPTPAADPDIMTMETGEKDA